MEIIIPKITEFHSLICIDENDIFVAKALPHTLDISAWLSLVGNPLIAASDAHRITVISAVQSAIIAALPLFPKLAIPYSVFATVGEITDITAAP